MMLLPPSLEKLIEPNHPVRVVHQVIEQINIEPILCEYKGGGKNVYGYLCNIYSSKKLEAAVKENIPSCGCQP